LSERTLTDLKILSLVCKEYSILIRQSRAFKEKAVLVIPNTEDFFISSLQLKDLLLKITTKPDNKNSSVVNFPWRGLKVDIATSFLYRHHDFSPITNSLEYLAFIRRLKHTWIGPETHNAMKSLLCSSPNLKHLLLDFSIFQKDNSRLGGVFADPKVRENLEKLEILEICEIDFAQNKFPGKYQDFHSLQWERRRVREKMETFQNICSIPKQLKIFKTNTITKSWEFDAANVKTLLKNNLQTLEEIWMHANLWGMSEGRKIKFSNLKHLYLTIGRKEEEHKTVGEFLRNHLKLETLDFTILHFGEMDEFLLESIREISGNLKTLHLAVDDFGVQSADWSFLGNMRYLKDVSLLIPSNTKQGTGKGFLEVLPRDQLQKLRIWSFHDHIQFWDEKSDSDNQNEDEESEEEEDSEDEKLSYDELNSDDDEALENANEDAEEELIENTEKHEEIDRNEEEVNDEPEVPGLNFKISLLQKFTCLRSLSLTSPDSIDDILMHEISKNFTSLEELEILNSSTLTDVGITGKWSGKTLGVPITNLEGTIYTQSLI